MYCEHVTRTDQIITNNDSTNVVSFFWKRHKLNTTISLWERVEFLEKLIFMFYLSRKSLIRNPVVFKNPRMGCLSRHRAFCGKCSRPLAPSMARGSSEQGRAMARPSSISVARDVLCMQWSARACEFVEHENGACSDGSFAATQCFLGFLMQEFVWLWMTWNN